MYTSVLGTDNLGEEKKKRIIQINYSHFSLPVSLPPSLYTYTCVDIKKYLIKYIYKHHTTAGNKIMRIYSIHVQLNTKT